MVGIYTKLLQIVSLVLWQIIRLATSLQFYLRLHRYRLLYTSRTDDIFIVTYPKSGTTWMQMILYQLTSDGAMDFPHINTKSPHFEEDFVQGNRRFEDLESPRIFKSHLPYPKIPKGGGKYIYVTRDGPDVALSYYHHHKAYKGFAGSFDQFYARFVNGKVAYGPWFEHVADWLKNAAGLDVLFLRFEDLKSDLEGSVRRIAAFCNIELNQENLARVVERSRFDFMKQHEEKFDLADGYLVRHGLERGQFLRKGGSGEGQNRLNEAQRAVFKEQYEKRLSGLGLEPWP